MKIFKLSRYTNGNKSDAHVLISEIVGIMVDPAIYDNLVYEVILQGGVIVRAVGKTDYLNLLKLWTMERGI